MRSVRPASKPDDPSQGERPRPERDPPGEPDLARQLDAARRRIRALEQEVATLQAARRAYAAQIEAIARSTSWRITRPVRIALQLLRGQITAGEIGRRLGVAPARRPAGLTPSTLKKPPAPEGDLPALPSLAFPLPGALTCLPELTGARAKPLKQSVSVVIPTFNAGPEFHWLLRKLKAQKGLGRVEVVVVDSGSSDQTVELAKAAGCTLVQIPNSEFTHSHARNLGAEAASGDLLLFTVQDAYPTGDHWLYAMAAALVRPLSETAKVSAVSCSEFPRRDSELFYNAGVDAHYAFLGCRDTDRVGALTEHDHVALRAQGQLSDVACMIPAQTFAAYRYEGRYAEDLILGVKMIRDGHRIAMISSVKVIHSHNRAAAYHLKRTFVDVLFLTGVFPDFSLPFADSASGGVGAGAALMKVIDDWRPTPGESAAESLYQLSARLRRFPLSRLDVPAGVDFGYPPLGAWIADAVAAEGRVGHADAEQVRNMVSDRVEKIGDYAERVYGAVDATLAAELQAAARKTLASVVGAHLAFLYLNHSHTTRAEDRERLDRLRDAMLAGV
jgi:hypothetical protein